MGRGDIGVEGRGQSGMSVTDRNDGLRWKLKI